MTKGNNALSINSNVKETNPFEETYASTILRIGKTADLFRILLVKRL